ncbi:hypothetical protein GALMADRAFT_126077 [Galerina marginata CBS 339.88]|uniref:Methyltransferase domain-containing protein n=1 Tax=Galerina marginata (strain CBS 339.88) TaxID=685588 RepID=A0A067T0I5_GALM3|nr:hypothetical protein GALMADRAFT_126077 [Galerina marginata CBS 339.88]
MASDPSSKAQSLAQYFLQKPSASGSNARYIGWQMDHRLQLVSFWDIKPGSKVLELGCGQGDCTIVLADAVGENGHVDAVDPGPPDYGSPYTLSQSQEHISSGALGSRITFHLTVDPIQYLNSLSASFPLYDYVVMSHCIWYFDSPATLSHIVNACIGRTNALCVAEWSLRASKPQSQPHVLTALLQANLEAKREVHSMANVRTVLSPHQILSNVTESGKFEPEKQETRASNEGLLDGFWEVSDVLKKRETLSAKLREDGVGEKEVAAMMASFDAVEASVELLDDGNKTGVKCVKSMDVWVGRFVAV